MKPSPNRTRKACLKTNGECWAWGHIQTGLLRSLMAENAPHLCTTTPQELTILFADIVGWTSIVESMSTPETFSLINHMFHVFDVLTDQYQVFKVRSQPGWDLTTQFIVVCGEVSQLCGWWVANGGWWVVGGEWCMVGGTGIDFTQAVVVRDGHCYF